MFVLFLLNVRRTGNALCHLHHTAIRDLNLYDYRLCSHVSITTPGGLPLIGVPLNYSERFGFLHPADFASELYWNILCHTLTKIEDIIVQIIRKVESSDALAKSL